jgi:hypothetical protein
LDSISREQITRRSPDAASQETHLRDTVTISGNVILFLRPDDARFNSYVSAQEPGIYEVDSDFGAGISRTLDSIPKSNLYKDISASVTEKRYVVINDCEGCPITIDRDSVNYGFILSAAGKKHILSRSVHSHAYIPEIEEYFERDDLR